MDKEPFITPDKNATVDPVTTTHGKQAGLRARVVAPLFALLLALGLSLVAASPASATSKGCTVYAAITIYGVRVPSGTYCATLVGQGTQVSGVQGEFYAPNVCNWDVTAEFFDNHWNWKRTYVSGHNYGCSYGSAWAPYIGVNASISQLTGTSTGYMCSTLRVGWQRVTSVCNYVF